MKKSELKSLIREMILKEEDPRTSTIYKVAISKIVPVINQYSSSKDVTAPSVTGAVMRPQLVAANIGTILYHMSRLDQAELIKKQLSLKKISWRWISSYSNVDASNFDALKTEYDKSKDELYVALTKTIQKIIQEKSDNSILKKNSWLISKYLALPVAYTSNGKFEYKYLMKIYYDYFVQPARDEYEDRLKVSR